MNTLPSLAVLLALLSCCTADERIITAGPNAPFALQARIIEAAPGDVIELAAGKFEFKRQVDIAVDNLTIRGAGSDKTILSFAGQQSGGQGIESTGNNFVIEGLTVQNTAGNAIKVLGVRNVTFRDVKTEWTGGGKPTNGAYGLYPVQCENVLLENCTAIGASDAGLYVGQCRNVIVRGCRAEQNVAGIEIENTVNADVYDNVATNNAGGILVFDLPGLQVKRGENVRVFRNRVIANNHKNFASPGNAVASVPPGTGVMIMATDRVEVFDNDIEKNQTTSISLVSYHITGNKIRDKAYSAFSESISIYGNRISEGGTKPSGTIGTVLKPVLGKHFPDILFDGMLDPSKTTDGQLPKRLQHYIADNGDATFANFSFDMLTPVNLVSGKYKVVRDTELYSEKREAIREVKLSPHDPPKEGVRELVKVYRAAPKRLSEYGLFVGEMRDHRPAENVVPYKLNTPLFSDYTDKFRFIRVPDGETIEFRDRGIVEFPVGSLIAKTFAYRKDMTLEDSELLLLETRIERRDENGWHGFSYAWNEEQTDAELVLGGGEVNVKWTHSDGSTRENRYEIPNANQCLSCHSQADEFQPLGPTASNLNGDFGFPSGPQNQLAYLAEHKLIAGMPEHSKIDALPCSNDESESVERRARAWLDVNCAHCHNPVGSARTSGLDLRIGQTDSAKFGVFKPPIAAGHGSGGNKYDIVPGKPDESILLFRIRSEDPSIRMPNVGRNLVPVEGMQLVRQWIAELKDDNDEEASR